MGDARLPVDLATLPATCVTDAVAIHFLHRFVALVLGVACVAFAFFARAASPRARLLSSLALVAFALQATLGALVVLEHVPITLASLHQANAVVLVGLLTAAVEELWRGAGVLPTS
jgi:heme A synthase